MKTLKQFTNEGFNIPVTKEREKEFADSLVVKKVEINPNKFFVVTQRDTKGMRLQQDKFSMWVTDKNNNVKEVHGSHHSVKGALAYAKNKSIVSKQNSDRKVRQRQNIKNDKNFDMIDNINRSK